MSKSFLSVVILILFSIQAVFTHPHIKLTSSVTFNYNGDQCESFRVEWMFDKIFSAVLIRDFDKSRDGLFDEKEINNIYNKAFINLKNYGYFVFLRKGTVRSNPDRITDFKAWQKNGYVFYSFSVLLEKQKYNDDFYVAIFDRSFYCAVVYGEPAVIINQRNGTAPEYKVMKNKKYPVYYNPYGSPDDMTIHKKWKPGLETAFPDEIYIYFRK